MAVSGIFGLRILQLKIVVWPAFRKLSNFSETNVLLLRRLERKRGPTDIATMTKHTKIEYIQIRTTSRERFMRAVEEEMAKFERREREFRKKDRDERAAELHLPLPKDDH
jgi:hypothetical protein